MALEITAADAIAAGAPLVADARGNVALVAALDSLCLAGSGEVLRWNGSKRNLPVEALVDFAVDRRARSVLVMTKGQGSVDVVSEDDIYITRAIASAVNKADVELWEHVVVHGDLVRMMGETIGWWEIEVE